MCLLLPFLGLSHWGAPLLQCWEVLSADVFGLEARGSVSFTVKSSARYLLKWTEESQIHWRDVNR